MSLKEVANQLVALCREGKNLEAVETLYSPDVVSVEAAPVPGMEQTMKGIDAVKGKNKWWIDSHEVHGGDVKGPFPHGEDRFAVYFEFDVTPKGTGKRMQMNEVGLYTVKNDKITKEEYFYSMEG